MITLMIVEGEESGRHSFVPWIQSAPFFLCAMDKGIGVLCELAARCSLYRAMKIAFRLIASVD